MAVKSNPVSVRISTALEALIDQEAQRTGRSRSAVLEALVDEALRMRLFPGVALRGTDWEHRAWVIGSALDVWEIVEAFDDIGSVARMADRGGGNRAADTMRAPRMTSASSTGWTTSSCSSSRLRRAG